MRDVSELFDNLYFTSSNLAKSQFLRDYLSKTPDPERGWVIAALAGELDFRFFKRATIKTLILERVDTTLFALSYDYVGEMSETVAHLWPDNPDPDFVLPDFDEIITFLHNAKRSEIETQLIYWLDNLSPTLRWTLIKLGTGGLRVGLSARRLKTILAEYGQVDVSDIENVWHGLSAPYTELLAWLEGRAHKPDISEKVVFHPVMLAHPLSAEERALLPYQHYCAEYKYDGIRVQIVVKNGEKALFSRTGDDISHSFPDVLSWFTTPGVYDGELLAFVDGEIGAFNLLQQRLNKKKPSKKLQTTIPCGLILYDVLHDGKQAVTHWTLRDRQTHLQSLFAKPPSLLKLSQVFLLQDEAHLQLLREQACSDPNGYIEGLMLKDMRSQYVPGRPKGGWYKYKRDAQLVDAVIMYAQRGHGKRSSFYSDFTFGLWEVPPSPANPTPALLPIGKAYSGFSDAELKELDKWVRRHTIGRFGPVKEVEKGLVFEVAFDAAQSSKRHKSGVALRFPRIHRIRWDKPAHEADDLKTFKANFIDS